MRKSLIENILLTSGYSLQFCKINSSESEKHNRPPFRTNKVDKEKNSLDYLLIEFPVNEVNKFSKNKQKNNFFL